MIRLLELFGGIGACTKAMERIGVEFEVVDYVEIDKYAVASYNAIHGTHYDPQDIQKWDKNVEVDLIMHGSPCQDFSLSGKQAGGDEGSGTRSSLMYETLRIVAKLRPKYVIWENVKNVLSDKHKHNFDKYINRMQELNYESFYQVLNSKDYGIPQRRERAFVVSIRKDMQQGFIFPSKQELKLSLRDLLEENVDEKYYLTDKMIEYISATGTKNFSYEPEIDLDIARPLTSSMHKMHRVGTDNYVSDSFVKNNEKLNIKEATKKGYAEAYDGDSVYLGFPNSKTRRGRVGHQISQTLQCDGNMGVVVRRKESYE